MRYRFVARLRVSVIALAIVGASLSALATAASAATFNASNTVEFEEAISKVNTAGGANTIVLSAGSYLPGATVSFTKPGSATTIEGPAGSPSLQGAPATLEGTAVEPFPSELFVVEPGAAVTFKNVEIIHAGGAGVPVTRDLGTSETQPGGKLTLEDTLVGGNIGQGVSVGPGAELTARNSTFSSGEAFGIINSGTTKLLNSTVAFNEGGGVENKGSLALTNTIVADNTGAGDCKGAANTTDHSLDSNGSCGVGALSKVNPRLTALVNDGGTTLVDVPEPASPAIGAGDAATCTTTDQRGAPRSSPCTIGAVERGAPVLEAGIPAVEEPAEGGGFSSPGAVAVDSSNDIWVADTGHNRVVEFSSARKVLRQFGSEGTTTGQFKGIRGIATNSAGDAYVADYGNNRVQEFEPNGTFLRAWTVSNPAAIAVDSSGNVWVDELAGYGGHVDEFTSTGTLKASFGTAGGAEGSLRIPYGMSFSGANLYIAELGRVQEFEPSGTFVRSFDNVAGSGNGEEEQPQAIATDPTTGNLYVAEAGDRVQEFSSTGVFVTSFGSFGSGNGQFSGPGGVAVNSVGGIFVSDTHNARVEEWKAGTPPTFVANIPGVQEPTEGGLSRPGAVAVDSSNDIWVADTGHNRVVEFSSARKVLRQFGSEGTTTGQFKGIRGIATNSAGDAYVADYGNNRVQEFEPNGTFLRAWTVSNPAAIAVDSSGNVWVDELAGYGGHVDEFTSTGTLKASFGTAGGAEGSLRIPYGMSFSGANLYIAELGRVQEFEPSGTFVRSFDNVAGSGNGEEEQPQAIATDPTTGNLYVAEAGDRVQEFSSTGVFVTKFGSYGSGAGQMSAPGGVAVNSVGNIFVTDTGNNRLEEWLGIS